MVIRALDSVTSRHLHSGQVITNLEAIVKELVENALDAQSTSIEVKLFDNGVGAIHVKDNGKGIVEADRPFMAKRYHTSKIRAFEDISSIYSYGFRGEALNSICVVAKSMSITTKTQQDTIGKQYELDQTGSITSEKLANTIANTGTIVVVNEPFAHLPVRRRIIKKEATATLKKIEALLITFGISNPNIRLSLVHHAKSNTWIKPTTNDIEASLRNVYGIQLSDMLERHTLTEEDESPLTLDMIIPKINSDPSLIYKGDHVFFFVNGRPINYAKSELKDVVVLMRQYYREAIGLNEASSAKKTPFMYIDIQLQPNEYDINIEPNKTAVLFHNKQRIVDMIERVLQETYPKKIDTFFNQAKKGTHPIESLMTTSSQKPRSTPSNAQEIASTTVEHRETLPLFRGDQLESSTTTPARALETEAAESSTSHKNPNSGWNFSMMNQDEVDELMDDDDSDHDVQWKGQAVQSISPKTTPHSILPSNVGLSKPTTSHNDHQRSSIQTTLTPHSANISREARVPQTTTAANNRKRAHSNGSNITSTPNITSMLKLRPALSDRPTWITLNNSTLVNCDFDTIKRDYEANAERRTRYHHIRINDYLALNRTEQIDPIKHVTNLVKHPELSERGLALYTRGVSIDQPIYELGVLKIDELYSSTVYDALMKKHPLICKRSLERPVQLRIDINDPLYSVMILLKSKEQQIQDDLHGAVHQTYTVITDKRIVHNGFQARWRKDEHSDCILVHLTSIYSLGSSYGVSDFRELLTNISQQPYDEEDLESIRPKKIIDYYHALAQKKYNSGDETEKMQLNRGLESLNWEKLESTHWMVGSLNGKVQACALTD
ncbi:hypothetical protein K501DRAFT_249983 [Backusella circina FSU 941]|nr:hypothetical protein K501DRAFT_249983 [Backusella circina FSU 941]